MKILFVALFTVGVSLSALAAGEKPDAQVVVTGNTAFAVDLYARLMAREGNVFFSPYSISTALAMTCAGARGETETQMARILHFDLPQDKLHPAFAMLEADLNAVQKKGKVQLAVANSLWPQKKHPFLPDYLQLLRQDYGTSITALDYKEATEASRRTINAWVETNTNRKITDLIQPKMLNPLTRLVLVDAVYFKGDWRTQFDPDGTVSRPFHVTTDKTVPCQLMTRTGNYAYAETPDLQVLELPYAGDDVSMIVLLPKKLDGLGALEARLTSANLAEWTKGLSQPNDRRTDEDYEEIAVSLPKFKLTCDFSLANTLKAMGITEAFKEPDASRGADFSGMDGRHWLYINAVEHKAFVEVNEQGTEAAAATAVFLGKATGMPQPIPVFRADHPFVFLIRANHTGSILFMGRVMSPPV